MNEKVMVLRWSETVLHWFRCPWPNVTWQWLLARCGAAVALLAFVVECIALGWRGLEDVEVSEISSKRR